MESKGRNRIGQIILIGVLCMIAGSVGLLVALYALGFIKVISSVSSGDDTPVSNSGHSVPHKGSPHETR